MQCGLNVRRQLHEIVAALFPGRDEGVCVVCRYFEDVDQGDAHGPALFQCISPRSTSWISLDDHLADLQVALALPVAAGGPRSDPTSRQRCLSSRWRDSPPGRSAM